MQYVQYHKEIVMRHGVALKGWTHPTFANPSDLSTSLPPLQELLDAIKSGQCKFVKLTTEQRKAEDDQYRKKIESGEITVQVRATRKDKGKKRKVREVSRSESDDEDGDSSDGKEGPPAKRRRSRRAPKAMQKSMEYVPSDLDD
jgi:hypothetical protein